MPSKKLYIAISLSIYSINAMQISPYEKSRDLDGVVEMVACNDDENTFMPMAPSPSEKRVLYAKTLKEQNPRGFVIKEDDQIVAFLGLVKRKAASQQLVKELQSKGPEYQGTVDMLLRRPNLPDTSDGSCLRAGIIVAKRTRRKGLATKLILYAMQTSQDDPDVKSIDIDVKADNKAVIELCEKFGFEKVAQTETFISFSKKLPL